MYHADASRLDEQAKRHALTLGGKIPDNSPIRSNMSPRTSFSGGADNHSSDRPGSRGTTPRAARGIDLDNPVKSARRLLDDAQRRHEITKRLEMHLANSGSRVVTGEGADEPQYVVEPRLTPPSSRPSSATGEPKPAVPDGRGTPTSDTGGAQSPSPSPDLASENSLTRDSIRKALVPAVPTGRRKGLGKSFVDQAQLRKERAERAEAAREARRKAADAGMRPDSRETGSWWRGVQRTEQARERSEKERAEKEAADAADEALRKSKEKQAADTRQQMLEMKSEAQRELLALKEQARTLHERMGAEAMAYAESKRAEAERERREKEKKEKEEKEEKEEAVVGVERNEPSGVIVKTATTDDVEERRLGDAPGDWAMQARAHAAAKAAVARAEAGIAPSDAMVHGGVGEEHHKAAAAEEVARLRRETAELEQTMIQGRIRMEQERAKLNRKVAAARASAMQNHPNPDNMYFEPMPDSARKKKGKQGESGSSPATSSRNNSPPKQRKGGDGNKTLSRTSSGGTGTGGLSRTTSTESTMGKVGGGGGAGGDLSRTTSTGTEGGVAEAEKKMALQSQLQDELSFVAHAIESEKVAFAEERDAIRKKIRDERRAAEKKRREKRLARREQRELEARAEAALVREARYGRQAVAAMAAKKNTTAV